MRSAHSSINRALQVHDDMEHFPSSLSFEHKKQQVQNVNSYKILLRIPQNHSFHNLVNTDFYSHVAHEF